MTIKRDPNLTLIMQEHDGCAVIFVVNQLTGKQLFAFPLTPQEAIEVGVNLSGFGLHLQCKERENGFVLRVPGEEKDPEPAPERFDMLEMREVNRVVNNLFTAAELANATHTGQDTDVRMKRLQREMEDRPHGEPR